MKNDLQKAPRLARAAAVFLWIKHWTCPQNCCAGATVLTPGDQPAARPSASGAWQLVVLPAPHVLQGQTLPRLVPREKAKVNTKELEWTQMLVSVL